MGFKLQSTVSCPIPVRMKSTAVFWPNDTVCEPRPGHLVNGKGLCPFQSTAMLSALHKLQPAKAAPGRRPRRRRPVFKLHTVALFNCQWVLLAARGRHGGVCQGATLGRDCRRVALALDELTRGEPPPAYGMRLAPAHSTLKT